jgi:cytochrome c5
MLRFSIFAVLLLAGCSQSGTDAEPPTNSDVPVMIEDGIRSTGKAAYDQVCAECHDQGLNGAPKTGDRDAWAGRSQLWEAVLFEHAKEGYMEMPAKGGEEGIDDAIIEMAAEYMLSRTYPNMPPAD